VSTAIHNLRNRIQASRNAAHYYDRGFVDVPINDLERLLDIAEKAPASAVPEVSNEQVELALLASDRTTTQLYHDTDGATVRKAAMRAALVAAFGKGNLP
jgi:uncharacterized protein YqiB (DUF1249 family)